jgi:hypothetical protein
MAQIFSPTYIFSSLSTLTSCQGPFIRTTDDIISGVYDIKCCNNNVLQPAPIGYEYFWGPSTTSPGNVCKLIKSCPTKVDTVGSVRFNDWNNLYISQHNGQSLSVTNPILYNRLHTSVINNGENFYIDVTNGELLSIDCCTKEGGFYENGVCYEQTISETFEPKCVKNLDDFYLLFTNIDSRNFIINNFILIGPSLGLSDSQSKFIINNIFNFGDDDNDLIPENLEARLILNNALNATGGFYLDFNTLNNEPKFITDGTVCSDKGGYWDGSNCMCEPITNDCNVDITQTKTTIERDLYNNRISVIYWSDDVNIIPNGVTPNSPIGEDCCNKLIRDYGLTWVWENNRCYTEHKKSCVPVSFNLNENTPTTVNPSFNDVELSLWLYIGTPENSCNKVSNTTPCCYNTSNPILAQISVDNVILKNSLTQVKSYNSELNNFNTWVELKATLPAAGIYRTLNVSVEITQGLNCCCNYDIFVDDIRVDTFSDENTTTVKDIKCPGFELTKVIDNKKSWVYNPGSPDVGISEYDNLEREDGSFGMLNGEGSINRTFAPSPDADIPWRYTDYFNQSSVYENHSSLVLNSKELWLTFDMCADCPVISGSEYVCPEGFSLSANTNICYQEETYKLFQDGDGFLFQNGDDFLFQTFI